VGARCRALAAAPGQQRHRGDRAGGAGAGADQEPRPCGSFAPGITKSIRTHHFRVLREAGLIEQWKDGTSKFSVLRRADLDARFPGLLDAVLQSVPV
jgi:hypothetical protein